jgi:hypothetical protein
MLSPGIYSLLFQAEDHFDTLISNINVNSFHATILNVELVPFDPVPVELVSFTAIVQSNSVYLKWKTVTEKNNYGFEVQRSTIGVQSSEWQVLKFITGNGTTTHPHKYSFTDEEILGGTYKYRLKQIDYNGTFEYYEELEIEVGSPIEFSLEQNYPNPFNPTTKIKFTIPQSVIKSEAKQSQLVTLKVYDVLGNEIATLVNEEKLAGSFEVEFSATGGDAYNLTNGVYFYTLNTGNFFSTKKMILLK